MPKPLHYFDVVPPAQASLKAQSDRLRKWMQRSPEDHEKIKERADELRDFDRLLAWALGICENIPLERADAYAEGYYDAKRTYDQAETVTTLSRLVSEPTDDELADMYAEFPWILKAEEINARIYNRQAA